MKNTVQALFLLFWTLLAVVSCEREGFDFEETAGELRVSRDTLLVDTLVSGIRSETYLVKVYNPQDQNVRIPEIRLAGGTGSAFRINVDGRPGTSFRQVPLRAKDSLMIFVEMAPQTTLPEALAEDALQIGPSQKVTLLGLVQGSEIISSTKNAPRMLGEATWGPEKTRVIVGEVQVERKLNLLPGAKVYFFKGAGLRFKGGAELSAQGTYENPVLFRGHRSDTRQDTLPKTWRGLVLESGAKIQLDQVRLRGAETGILLKNGTRGTLRNTVIQACEAYGIQAENAQLSMQNIVVNHCGQAGIGLFGGGDYSVYHSTLTNYWRYSPTASLGLWVDARKMDGTPGYGAMKVRIENSILHSAQGDGLRIQNDMQQPVDYTVNGSLVKHSGSAGFAWDNNPLITQSIRNEDPQFLSPWLRAMNLDLAKTSPVHRRGQAYGASQVPTDLRGKPRPSTPSIGAYQE